MSILLPRLASARTRVLLPLLAWLLAGLVMGALDGQVAVPSLALLLVLAGAVTAVWWPLPASMLASALALLAFNWTFVPPRQTFSIDLRQDAVLLLVLLAVNWIIAALMALLRRQVDLAEQATHQIGQLHALGGRLREADDPRGEAPLLGTQLEAVFDGASGGRVALMMLGDEDWPKNNDDAAVRWQGSPDADQRAGLWLCLREGRAMGPGTGWYEGLSAWYLPMRAHGACAGAALIAWTDAGAPLSHWRLHAQALCDQVGLALHRHRALRAQQRAQAQAQAQSMRSNLLASIAHDHRTPLSTILGAASALLEQSDRLDPHQQRQLAQVIVEQAQQLNRLTDNTLQLARLGGPAAVLRPDWESVEEIVGAALGRTRPRDPLRRVRARLDPDLPLVRAEAVLMAQLLDNLIDNALKYSPPGSPVEIRACGRGPWLVLAVRDRGAGVPPAWRERIFEVFERGEAPQPGTGAGVGLAVCRAIVQAHCGELRLRARGHGGSSFECWLPLPRELPPAWPGEAGLPPQEAP
ncbi:two-component system sensor histidine kinase KdpD [Sphaerotilus hippei]|uniref:histidine kinase n=1 Tax=Sphaerotilus hippei TaxID=744406 RepID=A0A318GYY8_9BURK|nr:ATP-binding protein [Sphaerotilus hippei]PXW95477.1 two-component system sensor histidine kinase KdpD [Sphaerotilus hippei]